MTMVLLKTNKDNSGDDIVIPLVDYLFPDGKVLFEAIHNIMNIALGELYSRMTKECICERATVVILSDTDKASFQSLIGGGCIQHGVTQFLKFPDKLSTSVGSLNFYNISGIVQSSVSIVSIFFPKR